MKQQSLFDVREVTNSIVQDIEKTKSKAKKTEEKIKTALGKIH